MILTVRLFYTNKNIPTNTTSFCHFLHIDCPKSFTLDLLHRCKHVILINTENYGTEVYSWINYRPAIIYAPLILLVENLRLSGLMWFSVMPCIEIGGISLSNWNSAALSVPALAPPAHRLYYSIFREQILSFWHVKRKLWKDHIPYEDVWGGKAAETNVFHHGKDSRERLFKTIPFAKGFHYHIWDGGHQEGREDHKINLCWSKIARSNKDVLQKIPKFLTY